jgi:hypothetical protein
MPEVGQRVSWGGQAWFVRSVNRAERWVTLMKAWSEIKKADAGPRIPFSQIGVRS